MIERTQRPAVIVVTADDSGSTTHRRLADIKSLFGDRGMRDAYVRVNDVSVIGTLIDGDDVI